MSDALVRRPTELTFPIVRPEVEEEEEDPRPPDRPIEPIHALQGFFLIFLLFYIFISFVITMESGNFSLLVLNGLSILAPIVGKGLEKKYQNDPILRRTIAVGALATEIVLFCVWQVICISIIG